MDTTWKVERVKSLRMPVTVFVCFFFSFVVVCFCFVKENGKGLKNLRKLQVNL